MDKLERLMNLVAVLLDTDVALTAEDLRTQVPGYPAEKGPTFHRAFERDKDDLREMGIPLRVERVPGTDPPVDGYRIPRDEYYLADPGLEADELAALQLATTAVDLGGLGGPDALWKLGGHPGGPETDPGEAPLAHVPHDTNLGLLFTAVAERRPVRFGYRGASRTVDPYRLDYRRGRWYVTGRDHARDDDRSFRLDRIDDTATVAGPADAFTRPHHPARGVERHPWELGDDPAVTARLRVDHDHVGQALQVLGRDAVEQTHDGGSATFAVAVTDRAAFRSFALSFLDHAEIESPPDLRADLVAWLERAAGGPAEAVPAS